MNAFTSFLFAFVMTGVVFTLTTLIPTQGFSQIPQSGGVVVAELFTSQSCSSCPAADKVLEKIAKNNNVIALSCHVTYWDHLNWKDTLSQKFCTERQKAYASAIKKTSRVYTPQLVVNGQYEMVGSNKPRVINAISTTSKQGLPQITLRNNTQNRGLQITLPGLTTGPYELLLLKYEDKHVQSITSGENRGKTVAYTNSVSNMSELGMWDGHSKTMTYTLPSAVKLSGGLVVLAHDKRDGRIVAAGRLVL